MSLRRIALLAALAAAFAGTCAAGPLEDWGAFERGVRDGAVPEREARLRLGPLIAEVSSYLLANGELGAPAWAFPLEGYGLRSVERYDFAPRIAYGPEGRKGYDFFDGNRHGGHPAHDIFMRDKDRDCRDDRTGKPVRALAMSDGVVLSVHEGWTPESGLRGGNYVWLYNPRENRFFYYAHLKDVLVRPGEAVRKGRALGTVGRTGTLAAKKRSPTHVHLMVLEYRNGTLEPVDYYKKLKKDTMY